MVECRKNLRFAFEACQALGVLREGGGENLYRDFAVQLRIARFVTETTTIASGHISISKLDW
jgi:hypothetical protein